MNDPNRQRTALVTGGAVRLGQALTLGLAEAGYDLLITYRSSAKEAADTAARVHALGRACHTVKADLSDPNAADAVVKAAREHFDALDLLVNSAATFQSGDLMDVDAKAWDGVMAVNVRAPHLLVRAAADLLREAQGAVVNITDLSAFQAWTEYPHHAVSKAALAHLTKIQARALAPEVRVNAVAPGAVLPPDDWSEDRWQALASRAVLETVGTPEDVLQAILYLAEARFVTGHILPVDGGRLLGPKGPPHAMNGDD